MTQFSLLSSHNRVKVTRLQEVSTPQYTVLIFNCTDVVKEYKTQFGSLGGDGICLGYHQLMLILISKPQHVSRHPLWVLLSCRYHVLVSKYGHLAPLAEVDLSPRCTMVDVRFGERVEAVSLRLEQTVGDLKKQLKALLQLPTNGIRLFYINREMCSVLGPEELRCGCRALHSYSIRDGDEILVVPKVKSRCSSADLWGTRFVGSEQLKQTNTDWKPSFDLSFFTFSWKRVFFNHECKDGRWPPYRTNPHRSVFAQWACSVLRLLVLRLQVSSYLWETLRESRCDARVKNTAAIITN